MIRILLSLSIAFLFSISAYSAQKAKRLMIDKSEKTLKVFDRAGKLIVTYKVALGGNPVGHKIQEGDQRTPEGRYNINHKKQNSDFYLALQISYPNKQDKKRAKKLGVDPGGSIMIHGLPINMHTWFAGFSPIVQSWILKGGTKYHSLINWTDGCIAITNEEIRELWDLVEWGVEIEITP